MKILIIRSCDRDMMLAQLCYQTAVKYSIADYYIFFHEVKEDDNSDILSPDFLKEHSNVKAIRRAFCDNFGGELNILAMLKDIKTKLPTFKDSDDIIFCDSDIIFLKNPFDILPKDYDHAGFFDGYSIGGKINHVSGQLNIIKGWLWNMYILDWEFNYRESRKVLDKYKFSIADDSIFSVFSYEQKAKLFQFKNGECWLHHKIKPDEYDKYLNL